MWWVVVVVDVFLLYRFPRSEWCGVVGACWCDGRFSFGGDGWFYPNRICQLGCRFGVRSVRSIGFLCVLYMCLFVEFQIIIIYYIFFFALGVSWIFLFVAIVVCIMTFIVDDCLYLILMFDCFSCVGVLKLSPSSICF